MGKDAGETKQWNSARERDRLRARYLIRQKIQRRYGCQHCSSSSSSNNNSAEYEDGGGGVNIGVSTDTTLDDDNSEKEDQVIIYRYLQKVIDNDKSAFSLAALAKYGHLLDTTKLTSSKQLLSTNVHWENSNNINNNNNEGEGHTSTNSNNNSSSSSSSSKQYYPQPTTLAASKFGKDYVTYRLIPYVKAYHYQITFLEYASLLGRYDICAMLLLGGLDPTISSASADHSYYPANAAADDNCEIDNEDDIMEQTRRKVMMLLHSLQNMSKTNKDNCDTSSDEGLLRIDDAEDDDTTTSSSSSSRTIPLSIWCYVVRAVIDMRINNVIVNNLNAASPTTNIVNDTHHHPRQRQCQMLDFGPPCYHTFSESYLWNHVLQCMSQWNGHDYYLQRNVVSCPTCGEEFRGFQLCCQQPQQEEKEKEEKSKDDSNDHGDPKMCRLRRQQHSYNKFMRLPATSMELKGKGKHGRKVTRDRCCGTWEQALRPLIQQKQSRTVRSDRFFKAVVGQQSSPQLVAKYLYAGVDINIQNEYGQTPLYLACWKGSITIVRLLLDYGANCALPSHGGSTCFDIANRYQRMKVLHLLEEYTGITLEDALATKQHLVCCKLDEPIITGYQDECKVSILIDPLVDHPGAGACMVDNAISDSQLELLYSLWQTLPISECNEEATTTTRKGNCSIIQNDGIICDTNKYAHRPTRRYFCDAEGIVQMMLSKCIKAARSALERSLSSSSSQNYSINDETLLLSTNKNLTTNHNSKPLSIFQHIRFLNYEQAGGVLPPHVDLCRIDDKSGLRSTHTFILFLIDCEYGGETALLQALRNPNVLLVTRPKRGRALIFPHLCPHAGLEVVTAPKLLLRGEVIL